MPWPQGDRADRQRISNIEQKQEILSNRTSEDISYTVAVGRASGNIAYLLIHQITLQSDSD